MAEADELLMMKFHPKVTTPPPTTTPSVTFAPPLATPVPTCSIVPTFCVVTVNVCFQGGDTLTCTQCAATYTYNSATNTCVK